MFYAELQQGHAGPGLADGGAASCGSVGGVVFLGQKFRSRSFFRLLCQQSDPTKSNHAFVIAGVFLRYNVVLGDDAEGSLIGFLHGIYFVSAYSAVKIESGAAIYIADGNRIGIVLVPGQRQYACGSVFQNLHTFFFTELLSASAHFPEHSQILLLC